MRARILLGLAVLLLSLVLGGCVTRQHYQLADLPLPKVSGSHCCWQASQQLEIRYKERVINLNAALARTHEGASLVLLDPLGRRMFSIRQQGEQLETWRSPEFPADLPERFLLASSILVWWPLAEWDHLRGSDWSVIASNDRRELSYRGKPILAAIYRPVGAAAVVNGIGPHTLEEGERVELIHQKSPLRIIVKTSHWASF